MRVLSAVEAITPSFERTKLVLFTPFRAGRTWKIAATGYVSTLGTFFFPIPLIGFYFLRLIPSSSPHWVSVAAVPAIVLLTALIFVLFVIASRLQFVFFDLVVNRSRFVRPQWQKYRDAARNFTRIKLAIGATATLIIGSLGAWSVLSQIDAIKAGHPYVPGPFSSPIGFFVFLFVLYGGLIFVLLAASVINEFAIPPIALENLSVAEALKWVRDLVLREPGEIALYAILKFVLGMAIQIGTGTLVQIAFLFLASMIGVVSFAAGAVLHSMGVSELILQGIGVVLTVAVYLSFAIYCVPIVAGISSTFLEAYKVCFLGGRYPLLGDLLDRSAPPAPIQYWASQATAPPSQSR